MRAGYCSEATSGQSTGRQNHLRSLNPPRLSPRRICGSVKKSRALSLAVLTRVVMTTSVLGGPLLGTAPASANETPREMGEEVARDLLAEKFASIADRMSPRTAAALPPEKLAEVWQSILSQLGPC